MRHFYQKVLAGTGSIDPVGAVRERLGKASTRPTLIEEGLRKCRDITKKYGTSFYFATQFFPDEVKQGIYAVYAFARIPDEIVDDPDNKDREDAVKRLEAWRQNWLRSMQRGYSSDPVMAAIVYVFDKYEIPVETGEAFLRSMFMDMEKSTYADYEELEEYMYGSAAVIGLMVTRIVGFQSEKAFPYAEKLGHAFQLTNFLRDIRQDCDDLGRIYMPLDEMKEAGLAPANIKARIYDQRFVDFMKSQIARNREVYREALPGIRLLKWRGRLAVKISFVLYKGILEEIEHADYDIFRGRVRTSFGRKLWLTAKVMIGKYE
ncbi:MAG: phytoene/squalene synthase family protein [Acidobacteriota bacterium]|nr:phytoene/squalene synthase family protein [Acidobacteriota bacterium]MDH3527995.1 phytoene/squalene synthase family protein [Acidobacteriota bacterium]